MVHDCYVDPVVAQVQTKMLLRELAPLTIGIRRLGPHDATAAKATRAAAWLKSVPSALPT